ncbi:MAG: protein kinase [Planctomycetes bacterium]|nr:protein kinase [Planctomycetota bacterium]MCW8136554.1 protein kinase [Planctomycetota bacterium]
MSDPNRLSRAITLLPLPLAQTLRRAVNAKSPQEQHNGAYYFFESALKLAASAQVGVYLSVDCPDAQVNKLLESLTRPSVGQWLQLLREVSRVLGARKDMSLLPLSGAHERLTAKAPMPASQAFLKFAAQASGGTENRTQLRVLDVLDGIVAYRNQELGHGAQRERAFYAEAAPLLVAAVLEALETAKPFGDLQLAVARDVLEGASQKAKRRYEILRGDGLHLPLEAQHPDDDKIAAGRLVLAAGNTRVQLHPLVVYEIDRMDRDRVGFLNQVGTRGRGDTAQIKRVEYLDYDSGERLEAHDAISELAALLSRVRGAKVTAESVDGMTRAEAVIDDGTAAPDTGQWIGDFELVSELGRGGMGIVYEALQGSLKRHVALKVLPPGIAGDPIAVARFKREIAALGRCDHPNVVKVLTAGQEGDRHYYAMEYVEGSDLGQIFGVLTNWRMKSGGDLREGHLREAISSARSSRGAPSSGSGRNAKAEQTPALPQKEADLPDIAEGRDYYSRIAEILADAARGVDHLHQHGIIHRDLKPGNIMLTSDGKRAVIMDLGLAQMQDRSLSLTASSVKILGTLRYMPPEQLQHNLLEVTPKADVYSLGATLYELSVLAPIFDGDSEAKLIAQVLQQEPKPPRSINSKVPRDLETIISVATAKNPAERYATAAHLADDLERFAKGEPITAKPPSTFHYLKLFYRKNKGLVRTIAAAFVILVATVTVFVQQLASALASTEQQRQVAETQRLVAVEAETRARDALKLAEEKQAEAEDAATAEASARKDADEQRTVAQQKAEEAEKALIAANRNLARAYLERAKTAQEQGDNQAALAFMAEAYKRARQYAGDQLQRDAIQHLVATDSKAPMLLWESPAAPFSNYFDMTAFDLDWTVACRSEFGTLRFSSIVSGQALAKVTNAHVQETLDIEPGGGHVAYATRSESIEVLSLADGSKVAELKGVGTLAVLSYLRDNRLLAVGYDGRVRVYSTQDWSIVHETVIKAGADICHLHGSHWLSYRESWDSKQALALNVLTGERRGPVEVQGRGFVSPDGKSIVAANYNQGELEVLDLTTNPPARKVLGDFRSGNISFLSGTRLLVCDHDSSPAIVDTATMRVTRPFPPELRTWYAKVSPDEKIVMFQGSGPPEAYDLQTGALVAQSEATIAAVNYIVPSPDGRWIVQMGHSREIVVRNAFSGEIVARQPGVLNNWQRPEWSPDGRLLAFLQFADDSGIVVLDAANGFKPHSHSVRSREPFHATAWSPDGTKAATTAKGRLLLGSSPGQSDLAEIVLRNANFEFNHVGFSEDGKQVHACTAFGQLIRVNLSDGAVKDDYPVPSDIDNVRGFDAARFRVLYVAKGAEVKLWEPLTGAAPRPLGKYMGRDDSFAGGSGNAWWVRAWFTPDPERILVMLDRQRVQLLNLASGGLTTLLAFKDDECLCAELVGSGNLLFTGDYSGRVKAWRLARSAEAVRLAAWGNEVYGTLLSQDEKYLFVSGVSDSITQLDASTGEVVRTFKVPDAVGFVGVALSPDDKLLLVGGAYGASGKLDQGCIACFRVSDGTLLWQAPVPEQQLVFSVSVSPDGKRVVTAGPTSQRRDSKGPVIEWDLASGKRLRTVTELPLPITCSLFSPDGTRLLLYEVGGRTIIASADDGTIEREFQVQLSELSFPAWDPSGRFAWIVNRDGELLRLSIADGGILSLGRGHRGEVISTRVSADGRVAVTAGDDRTLRIWDLTVGTPGQVLHCDTSTIVGLAIAADASQVWAAGQNGNVMTWRISGGSRTVQMLNMCDDPALEQWYRQRCRLKVADLEVSGALEPTVSWKWTVLPDSPWTRVEHKGLLSPPPPGPPVPQVVQDWFNIEAAESLAALQLTTLRWEAQFEGFRYTEEKDSHGNVTRKPVRARRVDANGLPIGQAEGYIDYPAWYAAQKRD